MQKLREFLRRTWKPFSNLPQYLNIENEWGQFKTHAKANKFQFTLVGLVLGYPVYSWVYKVIRKKLVSSVESSLQPGKTPARVAEAFLKQSIEGTFRDAGVKREGAMFAEKIFREQIVVDAVIGALIQAIKEESFKSEAKVLGRAVIDDILVDQNFRQDIGKLVIDTLGDPEVRDEFLQMIKWAFSQPEAERAVADLFINVFKDQQLKIAFKGVIADALKQVLTDPAVVDKTWEFLYLLLKEEAMNKGPGQRSTLIELMMNRAVSKKAQVETRDDEFKRILADTGRSDLYQRFGRRRFDTPEGSIGEPSPTTKKRFSLF